MRYQRDQVLRALGSWRIGSSWLERLWIVVVAVLLGFKPFVPGANRLTLPVRLPTGHTLRIADISELRVLGEVFLDGIYDVPALPASAELILDLGANCGAASAFFAARYPAARIVAYEVDPQVAARAQRNLESLQVEIRALAVSDSGEPVRIVRPVGASWGTSAHAMDGEAFLAPAASLDTIIGDSHVDLLKVDIEGSEYEALKSCSKLAQVDLILGEFHPRDGVPANAFFSLLRDFDLLSGGGQERGTFVARRRSSQ
jgi:FkbM family methyltransferase